MDRENENKVRLIIAGNRRRLSKKVLSLTMVFNCTSLMVFSFLSFHPMGESGFRFSKSLGLGRSLQPGGMKLDYGNRAVSEARMTL